MSHEYTGRFYTSFTTLGPDHDKRPAEKCQKSTACCNPLERQHLLTGEELTGEKVFRECFFKVDRYEGQESR